MTSTRGVTLLIALGIALVPVSAAQAAPGDLIQLPDPFGCTSDLGTGGCELGTALDQANSVAVSPDGKNAYVTAAQSESVVIFNRNATTGALTQPSDPNGCVSEEGLEGGPCIDGKALRFPNSVAVSPDGKNVYVAGGGATGAGGLAVLDRNPTTGSLSQDIVSTAGCVTLDGSTGACGAATALGFGDAVVVSPDNKSVYVTSGDAVVIFDRNLTTGHLTQPTPGCVSQTGAEPCTDGKVLKETGAIAVSPDNKSVYVMTNGNVSSGTSQCCGAMAIFDRNTTTGQLTQQTGAAEAGCISEEGTGPCVDGRLVRNSASVTVSPDNKNVYLAGRFAGSASIFDRNVSTLAVTQKAGTGGCITHNSGTATSETCAPGNKLFSPTAVVVSPDGENVYMTSQDADGLALFNRDTSTGTLVQRAGAAGCIGAGAFASGCQPGKAMDFAASMAVSPDNKSAYVVGQLSDAVAVFARGALVAPGPGPGGGDSGGGGGGATPAPIRLPKTRPPSRFRTVTGSLKRGSLTVSVDAPGAGTVTVSATGTVTVTVSGVGTAKAKRVKLKIAKASKRVSKAGTVKLVLKPKGRAKTFLRRKGKLKATLRMTFKAPGEKAISKTRKATFKFKRKKRR